MCKAYKKGRRKRRDAGEDEAETSADESRADPGTGEPESRRHRPRGNVGKRHEEGGDLNRLWRTRRQTTQGRRRPLRIVFWHSEKNSSSCDGASFGTAAYL